MSPRKVVYFYDSTKDYYEFTNFWERPDGTYLFKLEDYNGTKIRYWKTSEHYYQAMKFKDEHKIESIRKAQIPRKAFEVGQTFQSDRRQDWKKISLLVMEKALKAKFSQNPDLKQLLLSTGQAVLVEDAGKNDRFYGNGADCNGENKLGILLMRVREELGGHGK